MIYCKKQTSKQKIHYYLCNNKVKQFHCKGAQENSLVELVKNFSLIFSQSSNAGYIQLRLRSLECVPRRSFSFTWASHTTTFRPERRGWAAANPEEDYRKMWCHYKMSVSVQVRHRLKGGDSGGEDWHRGSHVWVTTCFMDRARMAPIVASPTHVD